MLRGALAFVATGLFLYIGYVFSVNALANILTLRYTSPMSVFYTLQSALFLYAILALSTQTASRLIAAVRPHRAMEKIKLLKRSVWLWIMNSVGTARNLCCECSIQI